MESGELLWDENLPAVMVAAHRGDWAYAPENSLEGYQHCIDAGVDIIETDVQLTNDGVPVMLHDSTLDRTTTGRGYVGDFTLDELREFKLKDATGGVTDQVIPTLEEAAQLAKGKIFLYLDKSYGKEHRILPVLAKTGTTRQTLFVVNHRYEEAQRIFGRYLEQVIYVPAVSSEIENVGDYVEEYLDKLAPKAFQFYLGDQESTINWEAINLVSGRSRVFVAATWAHHTAGHDDQASRLQPDNGWGWLIEKGVNVMETNHPFALLDYLNSRTLHQVGV